MYKGHHIKEYVSVEKMKQALILLKNLGHEDYQEYLLSSFLKYSRLFKIGPGSGPSA